MPGYVFVGNSSEYNYGLRTVPIYDIGNVEIGSLPAVGIGQRNYGFETLRSWVNYLPFFSFIRGLNPELLINAGVPEQDVVMENGVDRWTLADILSPNGNCQWLTDFK